MWFAAFEYSRRQIEIVRDLNISDFARDKINLSVAELEAEKNAVKDLLKT